MYLRRPELGHCPLWPGVVGEHMAPLSPGDQVQGPDEGEGVRGVAGGDHTKIARAIRQPENARVGEIRIYHWKEDTMQCGILRLRLYLDSCILLEHHSFELSG